MTEPRWLTDTGPDHSHRYVERMRDLAGSGADLAGEARLVDALVPPRSRVLDAGCGPGRTSGALHARGHTVVGVDVDPVLVEAARSDHPGPLFEVADLASLSLSETFDLAVLAGNVMVFLTPGSERQVLSRIAAHVPGGRIVTGFALDREYSLADFDRDCAAANLVLEHRFATWDLGPWHDDADWAVTILRAP
ncbi:class I SAM-dependent methyltransferase [Jatrophihabitans fulvus]